MSTGDVLVVGGGQAAAELIKVLRSEGHDGGIRLVGREERLPYDRPPLSKGILAGTSSPDRLSFLSEQALADLGVDLWVPVTSTIVLIAVCIGLAVVSLRRSEL